MLHRVKTKDQTTRSSTAPNPSYMTKDQVADYLHDLRTNRVSRPKGSRPLPSLGGGSTGLISTPSVSSDSTPSAANTTAPLSRTSSSSLVSASNHSSGSLPYPTSLPTNSHSSALPRTMTTTTVESANRGRPLVRPPPTDPLENNQTSADPSSVPATAAPQLRPTVTYKESGQRWMERQEARALREALHDMDLRDEARLHAAAQAEASELVWRHQNRGLRGDQVEVARQPPHRYKEHLRKGSYVRSQQGAERQVAVGAVGSVSSSSSSKEKGAVALAPTPTPTPGDALRWNGRPGNAQHGRSSSGAHGSSTQLGEVSPGRHVGKVHELWDSPQKKAYMNLTFSKMPLIKSRKSSGGGRKVSLGGGGKGRKISNTTGSSTQQGIFKNPEDQIYEDPEIATTKKSLPGDDTEGCVTGGSAGARKVLNFTHPIIGGGEDAHMLPRRAASKPVLANTARKSSLQERHGNSPSQKHNPGYVVNSSTAAAGGYAEKKKDESLDDTTDPSPPMKNGLEVRSQEIRSATSMRLQRDRSSKLPSPTAISDSPDRPIVSFDPDWQPKVEGESEKQTIRDHHQEELDAGRRFSAAMRSKSAAAPIIRGRQFDNLNTSDHALNNKRGNSPVDEPIPAVQISEAPSIQVNGCSTTGIPRISVSDGPSIPIDPPASSHDEKHSRHVTTIPRISVSDGPTISIDPPASSANENSSRQASSASRTRPLPTPTSPRKFPRPSPIARAGAPPPPLPDRHSSSLLRHSASASCTQCGLAIAGRIVSAAGERFHPGCFVCYNCGEGLECVAFYPEPESARAERLRRIERRSQGLLVVSEQDDGGQGEVEDGDASLRFYCHLDFHEFFSPRCKSCKTPVEGEVVVACGAEWHVGHFFCAQCGDPFDASTPFVEKDGYAWCVDCHTNRFSTKCKKCRKPVTDMVLKALGAEWHPQCFRCTECDGDFEDGRYFLRGDDETPVCVRCEEKRLKA
ncbi:MAG: hypothetical protein M1816_005280 [Peltula sp. TS41687]|nr:MAG: hypothetical protein M1816_005280 [Peltula sp. TS41687]